MFTGIVEELGEVVALERHDGAARLTVKGPKVVSRAAHGDSISVNGVCLTVTATSDGAFSADVMRETLHRSGIGTLAAGSRVNLERPLRAGDPLGGHLVQGHVDGTGRIISRTPAPAMAPARPSEVVRITLPNGLARYVAEKGSVAVDGVSLTVSATGGAVPPTGDDLDTSQPDQPWFEVSLIPATLELTTLGRKQPGELVNLEVDVIAKYVEKLLEGAGPGERTPGTPRRAGPGGRPPGTPRQASPGGHAAARGTSPDPRRPGTPPASPGEPSSETPRRRQR